MMKAAVIVALAILFQYPDVAAQARELKLYDASGNLLSAQDHAAIEAKAQEALVVDPKLAKGADDKYYSISLQTYAGLNSYSPDMLDITRSYIGIVLGNTNYAKFLSDFNEASNHSTVVQFSAKFSLVPAILRSSVQSTGNQEIDAKAEAVRTTYFAAAATKIHQQISGLIQSNAIPAAQGEVMEAKFISSAKMQIDQQVELAKLTSKKKLDQRLDKMEQEFTFQEFAIKLAHKALQTEDGALLIFGQVGKAAIDAGLGSNVGLNSLTPLVWWGPRGMSTVGTGQVQLGLEWITKNNLKVGVEAYLFHDRLPSVSGRRLLTNLIYIDDAKFQRQSEFWKINSDLERFYVKAPSTVAKTEDQFYVATGNYDGKRAVSTGALIRILPKVSIEIDATFNRPNFEYAITESVMFHATDKLTFYLVNENTKNLTSYYDHSAGVKTSSLSSAGIGVSYRLVDVLMVGIRTTLDINAECRYFYENDHSSFKEDFGCGGGMMINANY